MIEKEVQDRIINILKESNIDAAIFDTLPEQGFQQKDIPFVTVRFGNINDVVSYTPVSERYQVDIEVIVVVRQGKQIESHIEGRNELDTLCEQVRRIIKFNLHKDMADLSVFDHFVRFDLADPQPIANNLVGRGMLVSFPIIINNDRVFGANQDS